MKSLNFKNKKYYESERPEMLEFVPENVERTIEFGCSYGKFSESVKKIYKTESWGVDIEVEAIENAKKRLDNAILGEAMESLGNLPENYFDLVICNDFLEHLSNPTQFLLTLRPYMKDNSYLLCSLPNVRYWKNLKNLIFKKDWEYTEAGILDSTHLRFFTKKSIHRFINESGLTVEKMKGINPTKSMRFYIPNLLTFGLHNDMKYLQFATLACFKKSKK